MDLPESIHALPPGHRCTDPGVVGKRLRSLRSLVGDTPLLAIHCLLDGRPVRIWAKLESRNFTGSIKDRMALHILQEAYAEGTIRPGDTIVEATSGNTGISFAALGRALGHPVRIYMPDWMSQERIRLVRGFGAEIIPVSAAEGGFRAAVRMAEEYSAEGRGVFHPRQFESPANVAAHELTTGPEICRQLALFGVRPTAFVAGVGTGGTIMGVGRHLRERFGNVALHPLEPAESPTLRTGRKVGKHRIQGISDEFVPPVVRLDELDEILDVHDGDAILMAKRLAAELGLGVGISSGANVLGALRIVERQGPQAVVVTVLPDSNKKYLSTSLFEDEPAREGYLSPRVELISFRTPA